MKLGYDYYQVEIDDLVAFLNNCKKNNITILRLSKGKQGYTFYSPIHCRLALKKINCIYDFSIGLIHYMLILFTGRLNLIGCISFGISLFFIQGLLFNIEIEGSNYHTNQMIHEVIEKSDIAIFHEKLNYNQLNKLYDQIKKGCNNKVDYLNVYQDGSILKIHYTSTVSPKPTILNFSNLVASKDAIIKQIDVKSGKVLVKENDYVETGELLVTGEIVSTSDEFIEIPVEGSVLGYTYAYYEAKINKKDIDEGEAFNYLLFQIRSKLNKIDKIDKENIIKYDIIDEQYILQMQVTTIENIAIKGEVYEQSD